MLQRPGAIVAGKYRLEKPLARGGVGTVWVAHHVELGHPVAVKFLDPQVAQDPQARTRFEREARAAAHLRTPHIVQVFDYGVQDDTPYLVMELLQGETLQSRLRKVHRVSLGEAYRMLVQMGKGLKRAHDVGFVHRDLKPANIFLVEGHDDEDEVVKLLDFGVAKETNAMLTGESTKTGELVGSPHYMSPEQIRGSREVDARSDLWALGVILFKAVTGELPFPGEVLTAVITKIVFDPIPTARQHLPDAPAALDAFFTKALERDKSRRFQTVREMVLAFGELAAHEAAARHAQEPPPLATPGPYRPITASTMDLLGPSAFPSSYPGAPPPAPPPPSGSLPGAPPPPSGSLPGLPPAPPSISQADALRPPPMPNLATIPGAPPSAMTPLPGPGMVPEYRTPLPSMPEWLGTPSLPPASSATLTSTSTGPATPPAAGRRSRWAVVAALGAVALLVIGLTLGAMRLHTGDGDGTPESARSPSASATGAPPVTATPQVTATASASASAPPSASAEVAPAAEVTASAEPEEPDAEPSIAATAAPKVVVPAPPAGGGNARPPAGKKPINTID